MQSFLTTENRQNSAHTTQSFISKTKGVCGGKACIRNMRIPVWLIVGFFKNGNTGHDVLRFYPDLTQEDLEETWEYYRQNPEEIEQDLRENEAA